jgi:hypothetical protein
MEEDSIGGLQDPKVWRCTEIHVPATYHGLCRNVEYNFLQEQVLLCHYRTLI